MSGSAWVEFGLLKRSVTLEAVLRWYHVEGLKSRGDQLRGACPVHGRGAEDAFHVSLHKNIFRCFYCGAQGNILDFVSVMEGCSIREAAWLLQRHFAVQLGTAAVATQLVPKKEGSNPPLGFVLRGIDYGHPYLRKRGITVKTAQYFDAGFYAGPGLMTGRLTIPIHNARGQVVAYGGRSLDGTPPRYKLPAGFRKSLELFNLHRALGYRCEAAAVVVEGFFDCMRIHQAGFPCVVALMGSSLSDAQQKLLVAQFARVVLMLDGDPPGRVGSSAAAKRLGTRCKLRVVELCPNEQPDGLSDNRIRDLLEPVVSASELVHNARMSRLGAKKVYTMSPG